MQIKITKLPKSEVEIEGEIDAPIFESYYGEALKKIGQSVKIDGFREGKVPTHVLEANIPEMKILEEMASMALTEHYPKIITSENIDAISSPEINLTKLARNNPLGFKIKTATLPEIKLADYKKLAKGVLASQTDTDKSTDVTDAEVEATIMDIRKSRAPKVKLADVPHEHVDGEEHDHEALVVDEKNLPEFSDEFVKGLGPFEGVEDFKTKLKENIKLEKGNLNKEKTRIKIIDKIIENTEIDVPTILTELELNKILYRMESDITQMGMKFEDYLKHLGKTVDDMRNEFRKDGEKKAKLELILNEISKVENITASEEEIKKEVDHILEHYKDADPQRATIHAQNILTNEKIFQFLENQN